MNSKQEKAKKNELDFVPSLADELGTVTSNSYRNLSNTRLKRKKRCCQSRMMVIILFGIIAIVAVGFIAPLYFSRELLNNSTMKQPEYAARNLAAGNNNEYLFKDTFRPNDSRKLTMRQVEHPTPDLAMQNRRDDSFDESSELVDSANSTIKHPTAISFAGQKISELPYDDLNQMVNLHELDLSGNPGLRIDPKKFEHLQEHLTYLNFANNIMDSETFKAITKCRHLKTLHLENTYVSLKDMSGNYSCIWGNLGNTLVELNIRNTSLPIKMFEEVARFTALKSLDASENNFGGLSANFWFPKSSNLEKLQLSHNGLKNVPVSVCNLSNLMEFDISKNQLEIISEDICKLPRLKMLCLRENHLTSIPECIDNLLSLQMLDLSDNELEEIPKSIGNLLTLRMLDLSENRLKKIPESISNLLTLQILDLSNNELEEIPKSIGNLLTLRELDLSENRLKKIPESIGNLLTLQILDLSDNELEEIPKSIGNLLTLRELDLSENRLKKIPESIGDLRELAVLILYTNELTSIPGSIGNLTKLEMLDLSVNSLIIMPKSVINLPNLSFLYLLGNSWDLDTIENLVQASKKKTRIWW